MNEKEIHLRDYLQVLARRKSTVIMFFCITVLVTVMGTFTSRATPMYQASVRVVIERSMDYSLTGQRFGHSGWDPEFLQTQSEIIRSQGVAEKVVEAIGADRMYEVYFPEGEEVRPSLRASLREWAGNTYQSFRSIIGIETVSTTRDASEGFAPGISYAVPPTRAEIMRGIVRQGIQVVPLDGTRVVTISYLSPNPVLSMKIANSVAQAYIDQLLDMRMELSGYSIEWMTRKSEEQRKKLEEAEHALHEYKRKHNIVTIEDRLAILPQRLAEFSEKLTRAEVRRKELETMYNQVKGRSRQDLETISVITAHASVDTVNQELHQVRQRLSEMSKKFGPRHPRMIAAENELMQLEAAKSREIQNAVKIVENEYLLAKAQEAELRTMLDQAKFEAGRLNEQSIQLDIIKRQVDTNKFLYNALIKRMEEEGLTDKNQLINVSVIEDARMPGAPLSQSRKRNVLLGLVLGLFGGIGLAFFFEYLDNTVKSPEEIEDRLELPVVGVIERLKDKDASVLSMVMTQEGSAISESFKNLRASLLLSALKEMPRVLLVTSMGQKEGKTSVASSLALSMARNGLKVLLVDGDMRRPQVHAHYNIVNTVGLSTCLAGTSSRELIHRNVAPNLDIITAGAVPTNPSELLSSENFDRLIQLSRDKYQIIILDSPPLGISDAMLLTRKADSVLLIAMAGETRYEMLDKAVKKLGEVSAPLTGVVLNGFNTKKTGYYYNYSDYYYTEEKA